MQQYYLIALTAAATFCVTLSQTALWQRKEYRIDRIKAYMLSPEGVLWKHKFVLASALLLTLAWVSASEVLATLSIISIFLGHAIRIYSKGLIRPDFTIRANLILVCTGILILIWKLVFMQGVNISAFDLAAFVFFVPVLVGVSVGISELPVYILKKRVILRARAYRTALADLTVVGITGSVGKTSTKTYLTHVLGGESDTVVATAKHRNSPYSVAQDMLAHLSQKTRVYIAELGAYVPGEIAELADLTKPSIGIITAITNQHVGLFGSLDALATTKWELILALPKNGIAILNKDDRTIQQRASNIQKNTIWFSGEQEADVYARDIVVGRDNVVCTIIIGDKQQDVTLPIVSGGQLVPALAAVAAAHALGIDDNTICQRLSTLPSMPRTMELRHGKSGATIIDDSYSASEASVANAIAYLKNSGTSDCLLVLVPIIELGSEGNSVHERIGAMIESLSVHVFIYGDAYKEHIVRGLGADPKATVVWFTDAQELASKVGERASANALVVLEGRVPSIVLKAVL